MKRWLRTYGWQRLVLPLLLYTLVALFITWPLITQLSTHVIGTELTDSFEFARLGWWAHYALTHGQSPFFQSLFAYPNGFFDSVQWAQPLIYWPIALLGFFTDPAAAFNIWVLLEIVLCGLTAYWLCLEVLANDGKVSLRVMLGALCGGLVFMAFPTVQGHLSAGHVNILSNYGLPLLVIALVRICQGRGTRRAVMLGAGAFALLLLGNYTAPVYIILPLALWGGGYLIVFYRTGLSRVVLSQLAALFALGLLVILPFYLPTIIEALRPGQSVYAAEVGWVSYSTDPLNFIALSPFTPWTQHLAPEFSNGVLTGYSTEGAAYLGVMVLILVGVAVFKWRRRAAIWLVLMAGAMLFSLGPLFKFNEHLISYPIGSGSGVVNSNIVMPWALFQGLPLIDVTRTPGRFNILTALCLAVLASVGAHEVLGLVKRRNVQIGIAALVIVAILAEYQLFFPFPTIPATLPSYFYELANRDDLRGAVFDIPWDYDVAQKEALYEQTAHHKPLLAGYVVRRTPVDAAKLTMLSNAALGFAVQQDANSTPLDADAVRALLRENGVSVLVYHWQALDRGQLLPWATRTFFQPAYQDSNVAIFEIPPPVQTADTTTFTYPNGWYSHESDLHWLGSPATIRLFSPDGEDRAWHFALAPLWQGRRLQLAVDGMFFRSWEIAPPSQQLDFWLKLGPGFHTLEFSLPEGCSPVPVQPACLLDSASGYRADSDPASAACQINSAPVCVGIAFDGPLISEAGAMVYQPHAVQLGEGLRLVGFRAPAMLKAGQALQVETDWQATQRLPGDYHLFIHLTGSDGSLLAQQDTIPDSGNFPTTQWSVGQHWQELVSVPLPANAAPGKYHILIGWYRYPDLTRLSVAGTAVGASDGQVYLGDVTLG